MKSDKVVENKRPKEDQQQQAAPSSKNQRPFGKQNRVRSQASKSKEKSERTSSEQSVNRIMASIPPPREDYLMAESDVMPEIPPGQALGTNTSDITGVVVPGQKEQEQTEEVDKKASKGHHKKDHQDADPGHKKHDDKSTPMTDHSEIQQKGTQDKDHEKKIKILKKKTMKAEKKVDKLKRKVSKAKKNDAKQGKQIKLHEKLAKAFSKLQRRKNKLDEADK